MAVGYSDVSMQRGDFFIPAQCTLLWGQGGGKNTSFTRQNYFFPPGSQKNDGNNTLFMALDSMGEKGWQKRVSFYMPFSYSYTPLLTSAKNPGILMFKK